MMAKMHAVAVPLSGRPVTLSPGIDEVSGDTTGVLQGCLIRVPDNCPLRFAPRELPAAEFGWGETDDFAVGGLVLFPRHTNPDHALLVSGRISIEHVRPN